MREWPDLPVAAWRDTYTTLHMWTQIVGKIRLAQAPRLNHWWQIALYVTPRGLTTSAMPHGDKLFSIDFDFIGHRLNIASSTGDTRTLTLEPRSVADFYQELMARLAEIGLPVHIASARPNEVEEAIPFADDHEHASYDREMVSRCHEQIMHAERVLQRFRSGPFIGKSSPVHFFWGGFDLAVTRFSGRPAPPHPGGIPNVADRVMVEAYSHEVASFGWWPGSGIIEAPALYAYAYPEPPGFASAALRTRGARYDDTMREFILPVDALRTAVDADRTVLDFCEDVYQAAADLGGWDRVRLERRDVKA
jgi:hypothetical protein